MNDTTKTILSAGDILDADDIKYMEVAVPEWTKPGQKETAIVRLRSLSAEEIGEFVDTMTGKSKSDAPVRVLMLSAVGVDGQPLFPMGDDHETKKLVSRLRKKNLRAFMRIQSAALKLNGLSEEAGDDLKKD